MLFIIIAAELGGQKWGNYVHEGGHWIISLVPYIPAIIGLLSSGRWMENREDAEKSGGKAPMKNQKWLIFLSRCVLIAGTAPARWRGSRPTRKLGQPGIKATPIPGSVAMKIDLPEHVLDFTSTNVPEPEVVLGYLPQGHQLCGAPLSGARRFSM